MDCTPKETPKKQIMSNEIGYAGHHFSILFGYAIHMAGGQLVMPKFDEMQRFLAGNMAVDKTDNPDGTTTYTLIPQNHKVN